MQPIERYYAMLAQQVISGLTKRNMQGYYCKTKQEAIEKTLSLVPKVSTVSFGGSVTLHE